MHYEMYVCLKKETYESSVPMKIQDKEGWNEYEYGLIIWNSNYSVV